MKPRPKIPLKTRGRVRSRAAERCEDCGRPLSASRKIVIPGSPPRSQDRVRIEIHRYACWKCAHSTPIVLMLGLIRGEDYDGIWDEDAGELPSGSSESKVLTQAIHERHPSFYWDYSRTVNGWYGTNHCQHCGAKLGDYFISEWCIGVFNEPPKPESSWVIPWRPLKVDPGEADTIGIERTEWGVYHHLDGNPSNNDFSNLRILCVRCHDKRHHPTRNEKAKRSPREKPARVRRRFRPSADIVRQP